MSFELNSHQEDEVRALVDGVIIEAGEDPGVREESLRDQFERSAALYGDFSHEQIEDLFFERRKQVLTVAQTLVATQLSAAS